MKCDGMAGVSNEKNVNDEIEALRRAFVERLPTRISVLDEAMAAALDAQGGTRRRHAVDEVGNVAHGISGSAGLFGFHDLADAAEALEVACDEMENKAIDIRGLADLKETISALAAKIR